MRLLKRIPLKALGVFTLGMVIGLYLGSKGTVKVITKIFDTESVSEAINKPTQTTTTHNKVEIKKLKNKHSDSINFSFEPTTHQEPTQIIQNEPCDSIWGKLSDSKQKRLKRWLKLD